MQVLTGALAEGDLECVELAQHGASASVAYFGFIDTAMVHQALDDDPLGSRLKEAQPAWLMKRLQPAAAGKAIVAGIERRAPRIIRPRRWAAFSVLRGIVNPLIDARQERDLRTQRLLAEIDARATGKTPS